MNFFDVRVSDESIKFVNEVLQLGWLNEGEYVRRFENELTPFIGRKPFAVSSCTAALHLSLICANAGPHRNVLVPTQTFVATATAVVQTGAKIIFVDIDPKTGNISPKDMEKKITDDTVAVMPVHFGGLPCDMDEINRIAKQHDIAVIEDAAHALGAKYKGKPIGSVSDYTCFSFQCIKMLTTGDGGAIVFPETERERIRALKWFGIDKQTVKSDFGERLPSMYMSGYKYNMNNIAAALGLGGLKDLSDRLFRCKQIAQIYRSELNNVPGLELREEPDGLESSYWLFPVLVEDRRSFFSKMNDNCIPVKMVNYGINNEPVFNRKAENMDLPGQRYFDEHHICIPLHEWLSDDDVANVIKNIKKGW